MIYKNDLTPYRRAAQEKEAEVKQKIKYFSLPMILFYLSAFLAARVFMLDIFMPFGIAFFTAAYGMLEKRLAAATGILAMAGYLTTFRGYISITRVVVLAILIAVSFILNEKDKNRVYKLSLIAFVVNTFVIILFRAKFIAMEFSLYDSIMAFVESSMLAASSYIFSYGMPLYFEYNKRKMLSREEMIYIGLILAIIVSGMYDISYNNISLKNILGFFIVIAMGYTEGAAMGAATGASLGLVATLSDSTMPVFLGIFSFCGLISGIFRDLGKLVSSAAFIISGALMSFYSAGLLNIDKGISTVLYNSIAAAVLFMLIPQKNYEKLSVLINDDKRTLKLQKFYVERVKDIMTMKLQRISNTLSGLSNILEESIDNELSGKVEIDGLVEKLADRVCLNCDCRNMCWTREMYYTYDSFMEVLRTIEKSGSIGPSEIPESIRRKCIRPNELTKQANYIFEIFRLDSIWKKKMVKSRLVVSDQVKGISGLVQDMLEETSTSMEFKSDIEEEIAVSLDKKGLDFDDVLAVKNSRNRYEVTLYRKPCAGQQSCSKDFVGIVSKVLGVKMARDSSKCSINRDSSMCHFRLVETENYNVTTAIARQAKEDISGDNYCYGDVGEGRFMIALSDGMGSGKIASNESNTTVSLLEKFIEAGYKRNVAIKATNSVLVFKSNNETFATIDMGLIDLYEGVGEFVKIGAAPTFIKSGMEVDMLKSSTLPAGILDDIEIESEIVQFKNGDMIVMVTDGIIDANKELKERWVVNLLKGIDSLNPKEVAEYILQKAKDQYGGQVRDDMTVVVLKVWKLM